MFHSGVSLPLKQLRAAVVCVTDESQLTRHETDLDKLVATLPVFDVANAIACHQPIFIVRIAHASDGSFMSLQTSPA